MHPSVREAWIDYNKHLEGILLGPYADADGWVTIGMGNKIDPVTDALGLPFYLLPSGRLATNDEIIKAWHVVKDDPKCATRGHTYALALPLNNIRLHEDAVQLLINATLTAHDVALKKRFKGFEEWPADAQLAAHSMCWAMGFGRLVSEFPKCSKFLDKKDFAGAATECRMTGGGGKPAKGTLITRNSLNFTLFHNAAESVIANEDPSVLVWQP